MTLKDIIKMPTVVDNNHESVYRSYHILLKVIEMVERNDSKETIIEIADFLSIGEKEGKRNVST